jgi:hypothetical protein
MALEPCDRRRAQVRVQVLVVGLVDHDDHALGHAPHERLEALGCDQRAARIVRIRDPHDARVVGDRRSHRLDVVAEFARRNDDRARAARLRRERIHRERVLRVHGRQARAEKRERDELEHVVRPVAEHDLRHVDAVALRQRELHS